MSSKERCPYCYGDKKVFEVCGACEGSGEGRWGGTCKSCRGIGGFEIVCPECGGAGELERDVEFDDRI